MNPTTTKPPPSDILSDGASLNSEAESWRRGSSSHDIRRGGRSLDISKDKEQDEQSPLIGPREEEELLTPISNVPSPRSDEWNEDRSQETKSSLYLLLLTLSIGG